jgi:hypothetical protein
MTEAELKPGEWKAIEDRMPPGPPKLRVFGVLEAPTPGYKAKLSPASPQGINPRILILILTVTRPTGVQPQVITPVSVRYEQTVEAGQYTQVHIRADGELLTDDELLDVEVVH